MSKALPRWIFRFAVAFGIVSWAQAAVPTSPDGADSIPHFGNGKTAGCVPRARQRVKAVMNGTSAARFEDQPPGSNRACK
jgi:hypothetical protein